MASEATIQTRLQIVKGNFSYLSSPSGFSANIDGVTNLGPTPGGLAVPVTGVNVNLTALVYPGLCRIMNTSTDIEDGNFIMAGMYDGTSFFPMIELLPGESYVIRLFRFLGSEYVGTGTPADVNYLRLMSYVATSYALVEAFEK